VFKPEALVCRTVPEEVLFETENRTSRRDVAESLRTVAEKLELGEAVVLSAGDQSVTLDPPAEPTFEVKAERETSSGDGPAELSIEFELEWDEGAEAGETGRGGELQIE
jgi:amphi-Trp domain-containing protein